MANQENPVFIVECGRSGTTLLRLMLSSSGSLMIPPESDFLWRAAVRFGTDSRLDQIAIPEFVGFSQRISSLSGLELDGAELLAILKAQQAAVPIADRIARLRLVCSETRLHQMGGQEPVLSSAAESHPEALSRSADHPRSAEWTRRRRVMSEDEDAGSSAPFMKLA